MLKKLYEIRDLFLSGTVQLQEEYGEETKAI